MDIPLLFLGYFTQTPYCFPMCFLLTVGPSVIEGINHSAFSMMFVSGSSILIVGTLEGGEPHLIIFMLNEYTACHEPQNIY